jgi:hypothetical protein
MVREHPLKPQSPDNDSHGTMSASSLDRMPSSTDPAEAVLFVINLCASTSPLALVHPSDPALKRHTFFVTRHREDGRERFRLHMGYFATQEEAESLLVVVRDIYPAAWTGPAPSGGAPRRARATSTVAAPTPAPAPARAPSPEVSPTPILAAPTPAATDDTSPTLNRMSNVRDVLAQLSDSTDKSRGAATPLAVVTPPAPVAPPAQPVSGTALTPAQTLELLETGTRIPVVPPRAPAPATVARVLAANAPPPVAPVPAAPVAAAAPVSAAPSVAAPRPATRPPVPAPADVPEDDTVRLVTPEDTQTLRDIKLDAERNAPPSFAVQLLWSVTPIDAATHPHLAIFDAYTLYNVEGSRHGRRWYGLRLGFFKDPSAATQVAYYVRSDYPTVAVMPVAQKERDHAMGKGVDMVNKAAAPLPNPPQKPQLQTQIERRGLEGFELLEDDRPAPIKRDLGDMPAQAKAAERKAPVVAKPAPGKSLPRATGKPTGKRVVVRKPDAKGRVTPGATVPMEETLEILGASTLTIDESREVINDNAMRRKPEPKKPEGSGGRLSRLLNRLGGR